MPPRAGRLYVPRKADLPRIRPSTCSTIHLSLCWVTCYLSLCPVSLLIRSSIHRPLEKHHYKTPLWELGIHKNYKKSRSGFPDVDNDATGQDPGDVMLTSSQSLVGCSTPGWQLGRVPRPIPGRKGPRNQVTFVIRVLPVPAAPSLLAGSSRHPKHSPPKFVTYQPCRWSGRGWAVCTRPTASRKPVLVN